MPDLYVIFDGDGCWPDALDWQHGEVKEIARLKGGMASGKSSVSLKIVLDSGEVIMAETSLTLLYNAIRAIQSKEDMEREENV